MSLEPRQGIYASHPSTRFKVGDLVSLQLNPTCPVTVHRVEAVWKNVPRTQTGTMFKLSGRKDWIDCSWCWVDGLEVL